MYENESVRIARSIPSEFPNSHTSPFVHRRENASTLDDLCTTFTRFGFAHERLSAAAANARFPQYHLDEEAGEEAVFQASAGVLRATPAVRAMWRAAAALGAVAMEGERMTELRVVVDKGGGGDGGEGGGGTDAATVVEITTGTWGALCVCFALLSIQGAAPPL